MSIVDAILLDLFASVVLALLIVVPAVAVYAALRGVWAAYRRGTPR